MKPISFFLAIAAVAFLTCNQTPAKQNNAIHASDSTKVFLKDPIPSEDSISKYPYLDTSKIQNGLDGYIDTFTVDGIKFRAVRFAYDSIEQELDGVVEKYANGSWQHVLPITFNLHSGYTLRKDVNGDGYADFLQDYRYASDAYFYLPQKKTFDTAVSFEISGDWKLIDSSRNIYCDNSNVKGIEDNSRLYTFNGHVPVILYSLKFEHEYSKKEDAKITTTMNLYKGSIEFKNSSTLIKSTPINKISDDFDTDFDYVDYWKKNYKELLGYQ